MRGCVWVDCDAVSRGRGFESVAELAGWMELSVSLCLSGATDGSERVSGGLGHAGVWDSTHRAPHGTRQWNCEAAKLVGALCA